MQYTSLWISLRIDPATESQIEQAAFHQHSLPSYQIVISVHCQIPSWYKSELIINMQLTINKYKIKPIF